ncbi:MAG: hypothetical protein R3F56_23760 [Planctomycetota bacterium]
MNTTLAFVSSALLLAATPVVAPPSDPVGVYGIVDAVELLPNPDAPTSVKLRGAFALGIGMGDFYTTPAYGCLLFVPDDKPEECIKQWRELATLAGKNEVIGFSSRHGQADVRLLAAEESGDPGKYSTWMGLQRMQGIDYGPVAQLRLLPKPMTPLATDAPTAPDIKRRQARPLTFTAGNCLAAQADLRYVFGVETSAGERLASTPIEPGKTTTSWTVPLALLPGDRVTWRVHVVGAGAESAPVATAEFVVGKQAERRR